MTKNSALKWGAWLTMMVIANGTTVGFVVQREALYVVACLKAGKTLQPLEYLYYLGVNPDLTTAAWWVSFGVFTLLAILIANIFIAVWGDKPKTPSRPDGVAVAMSKREPTFMSDKERARYQAFGLTKPD